MCTHVQQLGLVRTFRQREGIHHFIKQLLALPFLPWTHVPNVFRKMEERAPPNLQPLTSCIRHQCLWKYLSNFHCGISWYLVWVFLLAFEPHFPLSTRSNVENQLHFCYARCHARDHIMIFLTQTGAIAWIRRYTAYIISFYQLISVIFREAELVQSRIAASDRERDVRRTSHLVQQKIATASERYMQKEISSSAFLKICGSIYAAPFQWLWLCQYVIMCMIMCDNSNTGDVYIETLLTPCDMYRVLLICIVKYFIFFHLQTRYWLFCSLLDY